MSSHSHSTYHSFQTSLTKTSLRAGLGFQASYTFSKSLDDNSSSMLGLPQNPRGASRSEKGPSTFDVTHAFSFSAIQEFALRRLPLLGRAGRRLTEGWQFLAMGAAASGTPFTILSGIQQTAAGSNNQDRPDQAGRPELSTGRTVREDYFGRGAQNASFFSIPIGRFGALGRNTFRGPGMRNVDVSLIKNTPLGKAGSGERVVAQFRAEFFNVFNLVNFATPANVVLGPGFGIINKTATPSRQVQFSLKILY